MGSERKETHTQQLEAQRETEGTSRAQPNACCFCWCCCCSCSWKVDHAEESHADTQEEHENSSQAEPEPPTMELESSSTEPCATQTPILTVRNEERPEKACEAKVEGTVNCEESPKPSTEEVNSWGQSFDKLMSSSAGREAFRAFLRTEFSEENILFWLACEDLKKETRKSIVEEKVRTIYEDYVSILSPKEVSLDSRVREVINRNMLEPSSCTFDDAQLQIYTLMQRDSYPRYMNSSAYTSLLQELPEQTPEL